MLSQNSVLMSLDRILGRREEKKILKLASESREPEFIAIYGRRRVGKTHLVREFFGDAISVEIVGQHGASLGEQLENFAGALGRAIGMGIRPQKPGSWSEAFGQMERFLESSSVKSRGRRRVVFLDEMPWLNSPRSRFLPALEHFWNAWGSRQSDFILVTCGSAASWMIQKLVRARGGLHNRLTRQIRLLPFTLGETEEFLQSRGVDLVRMQIAELFMTMGGIPHYLKEAEPGMSAAQIIDKTCFRPGGLLREEFDKLYLSLFSESGQHMKIIRALAKSRSGATRGDILESAGFGSGGSASLRLEELEESGFIQSAIPFGKKAKDAIYGLSDELSLFHLDWIARLGRRSPGDGYWLSQQSTPRRRAWAGHAFESLCLKHALRLKAALGIAGVETTQSPWHNRPAAGSGIPGAQVDLLIDRRDGTINLCEMKFSESAFTIDKGYAEKLRRKLDVFRRATGTRKNVFLTMVTTLGVTDNAYSRELVTSSLTLDDLF
jgi:hypothetical protein